MEKNKNYNGELYFTKIPECLLVFACTSNFSTGNGKIFEIIPCKFVIPYLDDIMIYSNSVEEHEKTLKSIKHI
jgi:hypothetical protein